MSLLSLEVILNASLNTTQWLHKISNREKQQLLTIFFIGAGIQTHNCTAEEDSLIQHCAAPLNELSLRLDELFAVS